MHKLDKKTLLYTSRERDAVELPLSGLVNLKIKDMQIGGSGDMQLKYFFPHHFFTYSMI